MNIVNSAVQKLRSSPRSIFGKVTAGWKALKQGSVYFYKVGHKFWFDRETRLVAWFFLAIILLAMYGNAKLNVLISDATNNYITSIAQKQPLDVRNHLLYVCLAYVLALTPVAVYYNYFRTRLSIYWREWLANNFFTSYFINLAYLRIIANKDVDNPNQRMSQDVDSFTNQVVWLLISFVDCGVQIYMWSGVLWTIAGGTTIVWLGVQWNVSHLLTYMVILYALTGTAAVMLIGRPLVKLTNDQMRTEGDLRNMLQEVAQEALPIAFYRGEEIARLQAKNKLHAVIVTLFGIMKTNRNMQLFTTLFYGLVPFIAPWFIGALYDEGVVEKFGVITQGGIAVVALVGALTAVIWQFPGIASFLAIVHRLGTLQDAIAAAGLQKLPPEKRIAISEGPDLIMTDLTVLAPDLQKAYVKGVTFKLVKGESLAIFGNDGVGKTELLQVLAGIHNAGTGSLQRPPFAQVMFLTQKPYLPPSTLRQAIGYPCTDTCQEDEQIRRVLRMVKLEDLEHKVGGLDVEQRWSEVLSLNEQQRLSLCRILYKSPDYPVMDEATSALEPETEALMVAKLTGDGKTLIAATNNERILPHFTWVMELKGDGTAKICRVSEWKKNGEN